MLLLRLFYRFKPLIPRRLQIYLRRRRARRIWRQCGQRCHLEQHDASVAIPWPESYRAAAVLTHDVETAAGQANIPAVRAVEDDLGVKSCWNFVVRRYAVDEALVRDLRADGHEIGVHGVHHDGKLFSSPRVWHERLPVITAAAGRWGAVGFRSPALLYDEDLLRTLPLSWDSSLPTWDPFQPQPGGCERYHPFLLSDECVELPVSLWQDFTLFEELELESIDMWRHQIDFIHELGGLINVIVHPDYLHDEERLGYYRELVEYLLARDGLWLTQPAAVADWVRRVARDK